MLIFTVHFVDLFLQALDLHVARADIFLKLFDLVVKDKFEFFEFLNFLPQILDPSEFLFQSNLSLSDLRHITVLHEPELLLLLNILIELLIFLFHLPFILFLSLLQFSKLLHFLDQIAFLLHPRLDLRGQLRLIRLNQTVNGVPRIVLN